MTISIADLLSVHPDEAASPRSAAAVQADRNWRVNVDAIYWIQPDLRIPTPPDLTWTFGRDGFLTAREEDGRWWSGCSVPLLAGRQAMKNLKLTGVVGCFVWPRHAGYLRACFEVISPRQAILAIVPEPELLGVLLHCDDFSTEIKSGRLLFAAGYHWDDRLAEVFHDFPGLPMPQQFIRTALLDDAELGVFTSQAQPIIGAEMDRRALQIEELKVAPTKAKTDRIIIAAGSGFDLSNLAPAALIAALAKGNEHLDNDNPLTASPLALAKAAANASTIVTADLFRADLPGVVRDNLQWITWITQGRIQPPESAFPDDALLLADESWRDAALNAGWKMRQIQIAAWPKFFDININKSNRPLIALPADTQPVEIPARVKEFSSHMLLWESIDREIKSNPLCIGGDPLRFLESRKMRMQIRAEGFNTLAFLQELIFPAYHQSLARKLLREQTPLILIGNGWSDLPDFQPFAAGKIQSSSDLTATLSRCSAIVLPLINRAAHWVESIGLPLLRPTNIGLKEAHTPERPQTLSIDVVNHARKPPTS